MAYAADSKSAARKGMRVRLPPPGPIAPTLTVPACPPMASCECPHASRHRLPDQPAPGRRRRPGRGRRGACRAAGGGFADPGSRDPARRGGCGPDGRDRRGLGLARAAPAGIRLHADGPAGGLRGVRAGAARRPGRRDGPRPRRRPEGGGAPDPQAPRRPLHQLLRPVRDRGARPVARPGAGHPRVPAALDWPCPT